MFHVHVDVVHVWTRRRARGRAGGGDERAGRGRAGAHDGPAAAARAADVLEPAAARRAHRRQRARQPGAQRRVALERAHNGQPHTGASKSQRTSARLLSVLFIQHYSYFHCLVQLMRRLLFERLRTLGTPGTWDHIVQQTGMFSYTGLSGTPASSDSSHCITRITRYCSLYSRSGGLHPQELPRVRHAERAHQRVRPHAGQRRVRRLLHPRRRTQRRQVMLMLTLPPDE